MGKYEQLKGESKEIKPNGVRLVISPLTANEAAIMMRAQKKQKENMEDLISECKPIIENVLTENFRAEIDKNEITLQKMWNELPFKVLQEILFAKMETAGINVEKELKKLQPPKE